VSASTRRLPRNTVLIGDALECLAGLPASSVDCVMTSPPYFQLRRYGDQVDQLGLEETVEDYVASLTAVCRELARVLKPTGGLWLNLGDAYSRAGWTGAERKSLLLAPERLLLALSGDGWLVRNRVVWWKRSCVPESVGDRLSRTHEDIFFLTRSADYFFDLDAIRLAHLSRPRGRSSPRFVSKDIGPRGPGHEHLGRLRAEGRVGHRNGKNPGTVWHLPTAQYQGAHFASFPESLVTRPILASCPERLCARCDRPWQATYQRTGEELERTSYRPACTCHASFTPGVVLDPFFGTGTVGVVAKRLHRDWLGIELHREYCRLAWERVMGGERSE
jgi:site-specific DNA-methyltransferase (adenine-specific)